MLILMPLAILSPAKSFMRIVKSFDFALSNPPFHKEQAELLGVCQGLTPKELQGLMGISSALAELNHERYQTFQEQPAYPAAYAFDGPAHRAFNIRTLDEPSRAYAEQSVVTLSGLYGCLRPTDALRPYRLEMGTKLSTKRGKSLYDFWGDRIARELTARVMALPSPEERFVVNVASDEYWGAVKRHQVCCRSLL